MTFQPLGWLKSKREIITSVDKDMEKLEDLCTAGRNVKRVQPHRKQDGVSSII